MMSTIVSPDVLRPERIPPRQALTRKWPVLHAGTVPSFDRARWSFHIFGLVEQPWNAPTMNSWLCLTSKFGPTCTASPAGASWIMSGGISTREVLSHVSCLPLTLPLPRGRGESAAKFVMVHCEQGFTTTCR